MERNNNIEHILNSLDGIRKAEARPFMYTRVMARLQNEESNLWAKVGSFIEKPAIAACCLIAVIGTNAYFIISAPDNKQEESAITSSSTAEILQSENFILASNSSYDLNR